MFPRRHLSKSPPFPQHISRTRTGAPWGFPCLILLRYSSVIFNFAPMIWTQYFYFYFYFTTFQTILITVLLNSCIIKFETTILISCKHWMRPEHFNSLLALTTGKFRGDHNIMSCDVGSWNPYGSSPSQNMRTFLRQLFLHCKITQKAGEIYS